MRFFFKRCGFFPYILMTTMVSACGTQEYSSGTIHDTSNKKEQTMASANYVEGQLLLFFKQDVSDATARSVIANSNGKVIRVIAEQHLYQVKLPAGENVQQALPRYRALSGVAHAEANYKRQLR